MQNSFDIIMTTWNRVDYTKKTIASLVESGAYDKCERFIIVDNHSNEQEMIDFLQTMREFKKTFIIHRAKNEGWATAVNDALGLSQSEFVFICNNDVEFEKGFIDFMLDTYSHERNIGILGVWFHKSHSLISNGVQNEWFRETTDVPAIGWLLSKRIMKKVGMLEERGICLTKGGNGEDSAYVLRMKQAGYLTGVTAKDVARHLDGYQN